MEWGQFGILILTLSGLLWNRTESRNDSRHFDNETNQIRREMIEIMRANQEEGKNFRELWAQESKEFHGRLCEIQEKRSNK